jgi:hypothetical protein
MSFRIKRDYYDPAEDQTWLGSKHATGDARTVTLDGAAFSKFKDGAFIPSGIALVASGAKFVPATSATKVDGFLLTSQVFDGDDLIAPLLDHGRIIPERAPEQDVDVATISNPHFVIVGGTPAEDAEGNG